MKSLMILPIILFSQCHGQGPDKKAGFQLRENKVDTLTYEYTDSSVPPMFHRSYVINVCHDKIQIIVDSYGDILNDTSFALTSEQFDQLISTLDSCNLHYCELPKNQGCTGGTGERFNFSSNNVSVFQASVYHCQGDHGNLCGDIDRAAAAFRNLLPDFETLLKRD